MRMSCFWLAGLLSFVASDVRARDRERADAASYHFHLLRQPCVQAALKMTRAQVSAVPAALKRWADEDRQKFRTRRFSLLSYADVARRHEEGLKQILRAEQATRLGQIGLHLHGYRAYEDPKVAEVLGLSAEQRATIQAAMGEVRKARQALTLPGGNRFQKQRAVRAAEAAARKKLADLLTPEQKEKWKKLAGAPFRGRIVRLPPVR